MGKNNCPICGKRLVKGVCPDCGGSFDDTSDRLLDNQRIFSDNHDNYKTDTVRNEEQNSSENMKVYISKSSPKKTSIDNEKNKTITVVGGLIMVIMLVLNHGVIPIVLGIVLRVITKKRVFSFLTIIAIVCAVASYFYLYF